LVGLDESLSSLLENKKNSNDHLLSQLLVDSEKEEEEKDQIIISSNSPIHPPIQSITSTEEDDDKKKKRRVKKSGASASKISLLESKNGEKVGFGYGILKLQEIIDHQSEEDVVYQLHNNDEKEDQTATNSTNNIFHCSPFPNSLDFFFKSQRLDQETGKTN